MSGKRSILAVLAVASPQRQRTQSASPASQTAAWVDVATDLWGRKENLRIVMPEGFHFSSFATLNDFFRVVEDIFGPEQRRLAPRALPVQVRRLPFIVDSARILVSASSSTGSVAWAPLTDVCQLSCGSQLFVFQAPSGFHSEANEPIPVARRVTMRSPIRGALTNPPSPSPQSSGDRRPRTPTSRSPRTHLPLPPVSPRPQREIRSPTVEVRSAPPSPSPPVAATPMWDETDRVFFYLATRRLDVPDGGTPVTLSRLVADTALLSRLLHEVGVNLSQWNDREFLVLRDPAWCAKERPRTPYEEFISFSHKYRSLVKLVYRHLITNRGDTGAHRTPDSFRPNRSRPTSGKTKCESSLQREESPFRRDEHTDSSGTLKKKQPRTTGPSPVMSVRELSPPRNGSKSPARLQQSRCDRLSCGLSSVSTAKDRKMNLYDPL